ncbi:MAG: hypothetical protein WBA89_29760 [Microcoleus sp.]|uniref:hypothetical protein n=1 Tax=Microcoleus sp. TaxID=44472 RepID=UPI003C796434
MRFEIGELYNDRSNQGVERGATITLFSIVSSQKLNLVWLLTKPEPGASIFYFNPCQMPCDRTGRARTHTKNAFYFRQDALTLAGTKNQVSIPKTEAAPGKQTLKSCYQNSRYLFSAIACCYLRFESALPQVWGCKNLSGNHPETGFFYQRRSLQPPTKVEKPETLEFLCLSPLVMSIADSELLQGFSQQLNNY